MKKLKKILQEVLIENAKLNEALPQTKIFDQGSLNDIVKQIQKMLFPHIDPEVEYTEHRFGDGTGGFRFSWEHGVKWFGSLGLSLRKDGNHMLYASSMYNGKRFGNEKIDPKKLPTPQKDFLRHIRTWKDLDNLTMQTIITVLKKDVIKNEEDANKAFEQDRQGQMDFYGGGGKGYFKQKGRIGYGL